MRFVLAMYVVSGGVLWLAGTLLFTGGRRMQQLRRPVRQLPGEESPAILRPRSSRTRKRADCGFPGRMNFIEQWHPSFHSPYQGPLSLTPQGEHALSRVFTLFTGVELTGYAEALFQLESAGGERDWQWLRLAGFTSGCRSQSFAGFKPYVGRTMLHFAIP